MPLTNASAFQSTHPLRGAISTSSPFLVIVAISIHAPLAGCDPTTICARPMCTDFNPRTPCGVRPRARRLFSAMPEFQSTHPLRGATKIMKGSPFYQDISIHAPLAGCDSGDCRPCHLRVNFNPRTPCGVRLPPEAWQSYPAYFNPRTPCGVRLPPEAWQSYPAYFNPRTPCGVRRMIPMRSLSRK